jgi:ribosome-binding protein aMBF1 (putative translation factor)
MRVERIVDAEARRERGGLDKRRRSAARSTWQMARPPSAEQLIGAERLGRAVRRARLDAGLSQRNLGSRAWVHQSTISRIETGRLEAMRFSTFLRLLDALEVEEVVLTVRTPPWWRVGL